MSSVQGKRTKSEVYEVSEAVKILSRIERVRTRNFENKSEGEFYSVFPGLYKKYYILDVHKEQRVS